MKLRRLQALDSSGCSCFVCRRKGACRELVAGVGIAQDPMSFQGRVASEIRWVFNAEIMTVASRTPHSLFPNYVLTRPVAISCFNLHKGPARALIICLKILEKLVTNSDF